MKIEQYLEEITGKDNIMTCCGNCEKKMVITNTINSFTGEHEFLSNSYDCVQESTMYYLDEEDEVKSIKDTFRTVEHVFQASKTLKREEQIQIRDAASAKQAKRLGRRVELRNDWESKKVNIMDRLVRDKFFQHYPLKLKLLNLENKELVDSSDEDLGRILMNIRDEIIRNQGGFEEQVREFLMRNQLDFVSEMIRFER